MTVVAWTPELERIARGCVAGYFLPGADDVDLVQQARIGVYKAVRDFNPDRGSFEGFAYLCGRREVITAVKAATRRKHEALNGALSLDAELPVSRDGGTISYADLVAIDWKSDPLRIVIALEAVAELVTRLGQLTPLEREAVRRIVMLGESYETAAARGLGTPKRIDNALQRARRKLHGADLAA